MGGVNSGQTLVPEVYAMLWNTNGLFKGWLEPKNTWEQFGKRRKKRRKRDLQHESDNLEHSLILQALSMVAQEPRLKRDLKRYSEAEWLNVVNGYEETSDEGKKDGSAKSETKGKKVAGKAAPPTEDPQTWSQEFDEDTEFVDAADLLDE